MSAFNSTWKIVWRCVEVVFTCCRVAKGRLGKLYDITAIVWSADACVCPRVWRLYVVDGEPFD